MEPEENENLRSGRMKYSLNLIVKGKNKKAIMAAISIVLLLVFAATAMSLKSEDGSSVTAVADVDKGIARTGELLSFTAEGSEGDIEAYIWDFGNGDSSEEMNPSITYLSAGWYNVTLVVTGGNGDSDKTVIIIGIQMEDLSRNRVIYRRINYIGGRTGSSEIADIGPNVGNPRIEVQFSLTTAYGDFELVLNVGIDLDITNLYYETFSSNGEDVERHIIIESTEIPEEMERNEALMGFGYYLDGRGGYVGGSLTLEIIFPMDNLQPK